MKINMINFDDSRQFEGADALLAEVKSKIEARINLKEYTNNIQPVLLNKNTLFRCFIKQQIHIIF